MDQLAPPAHLRACSTHTKRIKNEACESASAQPERKKKSEQRAIEVSRQQRVLYLKGKDGKFCKREYIFYIYIVCVCVSVFCYFLRFLILSS